MSTLSRRKLIAGGVSAIAGLGGLAVAARLARRYGLVPPDGGGVYGPGETLTYAVDRILTAHTPIHEFPRSMISKNPFANAFSPPTDAFKQSQAKGFADWRLTINGLVAHPMSFSLADLRAMGMRNQITEVACEEGWSYIAEWIGTPLPAVLREAGVLPQTRHIVYTSIDMEWWESIDMQDAFDEHTLLTWGMNDGDLPVGFGGPLRLRLPRQLGYKSVKFLNHLTATDSIKKFGSGQGSSEPDFGYTWFAGI